MCGGLELIEPLQMHANHQIYERSLKILENYFQDTEENMLDVNLSGGTSTPNTFNF